MASKNYYLQDKTQALTFPGGVNLNKDPKAILDSQATQAKNLYPSISGILQKRPGLTAEKAIGSDAGLMMYSMLGTQPNFGDNYVGHYLTPLDGSEYIFHGNLPPILLGNIPFGNNNNALGVGGFVATGVASRQVEPVCYCKIGSEILATRKQGFTYSLDKSQKGLLSIGKGFQDFKNDGQTQTIPVVPSVVCTYKGRACYFNFGVGMENWGVMSDSINQVVGSNSPAYLIIGSDVLSANGRHLNFGAIAGERIIAAFEVMLQAVGSPTDSALVILTNRSMLICTGEINNTFDTGASGYLGSFNIAKVNYDVGCASPNTVVHTPYGYVWASATDVWMLAGNVPVKIGTNITQALQACPPDCTKFWTAAYCKDPGVYVLDIIINRGIDDSFLQHNQWWLPLNDASMPQNADQARWFGPMVCERDNGLQTTPYDTASTYHGGICTSQDETEIVKVVCDYGYSDGLHSNVTLVSCTNQGSSDDITFMVASQGRKWAPSDLVNQGEIIRPGFVLNNGRLFWALVGGTTDTTEPNWPADGTGVATDGSVVWLGITGSFGSARSPYRSLNFGTTNEADPTLLSDYRSKLFAFGSPGLDKQYKRIEASAYASIPTLVTTSIIANGGSTKQIAGEATFGQNYSLRAGDGVDQTIIGEGEMEGRSMRPLETANIIRGKYLQAEFEDSGKIVIDETNNALVFGIFNRAGGTFVTTYQANIALSTNGAQNIRIFGNMQELMLAVKLAMDVAIGVTFVPGPDINLGGISVPSTGAFSPAGVTVQGIYPYFQNIGAQINSRARTDNFIALLHGASDAVDVGNTVPFIPAGGTFDFRKSRRLMAIMGFDNDTTPGTADLTGFGGPDNIFYRPETFSLADGYPANSAGIWAQNQVGYTHSGRLAYGGGVMIVRPTNVSPLQNANR